MKRDPELRCTGCGADAVAGYVAENSPLLVQASERLCLRCYDIRRRGAKR